MAYTIGVQELLERPVIRDDFSDNDEWMNKMTDEEIKQWDNEVYQSMREDGVPEKYPEWNTTYMAKVIDRGILYKLFKMAHEPFSRK